MKYWFGLILVISVEICGAQTVSGKIYDKASQLVLVGANIKVLGSEKGSISDDQGIFELSGLKPGRIDIEVSYLGYEKIKIHDIWIKSGVTTTQDIYLDRSFSNLDEVVVSVGNSMSVPGRVTITEEQINRYAATYYDPARLITSSPDVAITNDQNNQISVRGLSPNYNTWRLEGAEIINPNHLSNAGTFLDQPSATGGGVNMLSAQMLSSSDFLYGSFENQFGNGIGGIFDMHMKNGNPNKKQYTAQASLIGFDLASEGPLKNGSPITYAVNYRYSFTGLLTNFGVDFGGESIGFQDLAFNITSPLGNRTKLKIFGVGGLSFNDFEHQPFEKSKVEKDRNDINYDNQTGIIGAKMSTGFVNGNLNNTLVYSGYDNQRDQETFGPNDDSNGLSTSHQSRSVLSFHSQYMYYFQRSKLTIGTMLNHYHWERVADSFNSNNYNQWYIQPYAQLTFSINNVLSLNMGVTQNAVEAHQTIDPRLNLLLNLGMKSSLSAGIGSYSQLKNPFNYIFSNPYGNERWNNGNYGFIKSQRYTLGYQFENESFGLGAEAFFYQFPQVSKVSDGILASAEASTYGVSLSAEQSFAKYYYYRLGGSLFQSTFDDGSNNHNNTKYNLSLSGGKEWQRAKGEKQKSFAANFKLLYQGGQYYDGLPLYSNLTEFIYLIDAHRIDPFLRIDLRLIWTRYREGRTSSISLDIQNVTNYQNESFRYYDNFTNSEESQYNLGLIPILTYRVEW